MATMVETPVKTDASIREAVISELKWDPKLSNPDDIAVAVKDGVVTLSGFVHSYWEKDAAEKAAKRVYGVKAVADDIEIRLTGTRTDPEIAREAVAELQSHISLPADRIKVTVRNGWVTLEGTVDWQYQKTLAVTAADVKRVANKYLTAGRVVLSVVPLGKTDQASKPAESQSVK